MTLLSGAPRPRKVCPPRQQPIGRSRAAGRSFPRAPAAMSSATRRATTGSAASAAQLASPVRASAARSARRRSRAGSGVHRRSVKIGDAPLSRGRGANRNTPKPRSVCARTLQKRAMLSLNRFFAVSCVCYPAFARKRTSLVDVSTFGETGERL